MELGYKNYLISSMNQTVVKQFWEQGMIDYCYTLGRRPRDFYEAWTTLRNIKDDEYCGIGLNEKAKAYIYDVKTEQFYWYSSPYDAAYVVNDKFGTLITEEIFNKMRGRFHYSNGDVGVLLSSDELNRIDDYLYAEPVIYCSTNGIEFQDVDAAANWLVQIGKAKTVQSAKTSLNKHLLGKTMACYGMMFERR